MHGFDTWAKQHELAHDGRQALFSRRDSSFEGVFNMRARVP